MIRILLCQGLFLLGLLSQLNSHASCSGQAAVAKVIPAASLTPSAEDFTDTAKARASLRQRRRRTGESTIQGPQHGITPRSPHIVASLKHAPQPYDPPAPPPLPEPRSTVEGLLSAQGLLSQSSMGESEDETWDITKVKLGLKSERSRESSSSKLGS